LGLADQYATLVDFSAYFAVSCLDSTWPTDPDEHLAAAEAANRTSPRFGEALVNDYLRCTLWPVDPDPLGAITAAGSGPLLLVSTTGDPATPHEGALVVGERLDDASLLTHEGDGHTVVFQGDACVDDVVVRYLVAGELPAEGATC
ncbi:MAG TPA: alpha/beta hydrolase, partial [Acidimicrobiales bacterium]|nr:alpha/beta hydrolase [Acidimicrobiales bacterium]